MEKNIKSVVEDLVKPALEGIKKSLNATKLEAIEIAKQAKLMTQVVDDITRSLPRKLISGITTLTTSGIKKRLEKSESLYSELGKTVMKNEEFKQAVKQIEYIIEFVYALEKGCEDGVNKKKETINLRIKWTFDALQFLFQDWIKDVPELQTELDAAFELLTGKDKDRARPLEGIFRAELAFGKRLDPFVAIIGWVVECVDNGKLAAPKLKLLIAPGRLYSFIYDDISIEERQFRIEFIGVVDKFVQGEFGISMPLPSVSFPKRSKKSAKSESDDASGYDQDSLTSAGRSSINLSMPKVPMDSLPSVEIFTGLIRTCMRSVFGMIFRLPGMPSPTVPKMSLLRSSKTEPKPSSVRASQTFSRTVSMPIKAITGTALRGVWEVNAHNTSLVESVTALISEFIGGLIESILQALLSLFEVRELLVAPDQDNNQCFYSWEKILEDGKTKAWDVIWVRDPNYANLIKTLRDFQDTSIKRLEESIHDSGDRAKLPAITVVENLLKDYAAYLEINRVLQEPENLEEILEPSLKKTGKNLVVSVPFVFENPKLPPVLRAYAEGKSIILKFDEANNRYLGTMQVDDLQNKHLQVNVISRELAQGVAYC